MRYDPRMAPAPPARRSPLELPADPQRFVGRAAELQVLDGLLQKERLVTLVGAPGVGKTRCAHHHLEGRVPEGCFVELAEARTATEMCAAIEEVLGLPAASHGAGPPGLRLGEALAARGDVLLVLDNLEHLVEEARLLLSSWLAMAPRVRFLVTSIARLGLEQEACLELQGLPVQEAAALYVERASRVQADLDEGDPWIVPLVERLEGMPLAIELAAARAHVLRPRQLLSRLQSDFGLLRQVRRSAGADRHASVQTAIRWALALLTPVEAAVLSQCTVFAGGFTLDAAEAVLDPGEGPDRPPILDVLEGLRAKSFLQMAPGDPPRFRMLESIRALAAGGDLAPARARHLRHFVDRADRGLDGTASAEQLRWLLAERENIRAAHRHAAKGAPIDRARASLAWARVLALRGPPISEAGVLDEGLQAARVAGDDRLLVRVLRARANVAMRHGDLEDARRRLEEAQALVAHVADPTLEAQVGIECGRLAQAQGRFDEARTLLDRWIEATDVAGPAFLAGHARNLRGMVSESRGLLDQAVADFEQARERFRQADDRRFEALALMNLGVVHERQGRLADAAALLEKAHAAFCEIDDRAGAADAVTNLGSVHLTAGRLDEGEASLQLALRLEREVANRRAEAFCLLSLGLLAHERGELRAAEAFLRDGLALCRAIGERHFHGLYLPFFAAVEAALGHLHEARTDFAEARAYAEELGDPAGLHTLEVLEGFVDLARGAAIRTVRVRLEDARAWLDDPDPMARSALLVVAARLLSLALEDRSGRGAPQMHPGPPAPQALQVGPEGSFFHAPGGEPVDLRRRRAPRLLFRALVERRLAAPGVGLSVQELAAAGWPGDRSLPSATAARVYVAIRTLRALGLTGILRRQDDGYLLDPAVPVRRTAARF